MLKFNCRLLVVLTVFALIGGCRRAVELADAKPPKDTSLQPVDLVLKIAGVADEQYADDPFAAPAYSDVVSEDRAMGITVTRQLATTRTPERDEMIKDLNIFLFHKERDTIVRHYYVNNSNPLQPFAEIRLNNLYMGNYYCYIVANNGRSLCDNHTSEFGCSHHRADMSEMMSSKVSAGTPYNLMVYSDPNFQIKRSEDRFEFLLQRLTSRFDIKFVNNRDKSLSHYDYIELDNYTVLNIPLRTKLFPTAAYVPQKTDLDNRIGNKFKFDPDTATISRATITLINNMQGDVSPTIVPSYVDRNPSLAPSLASCVMVYATYHIDRYGNNKQNIIYPIYLGGPGEQFNNYDVVKGQKYQYTVTFNQPDFDDPRLSRFQVFYETSLFSDANNQTTTFISGQTISRPLDVEYSTIHNNGLMISCEHTVAIPPTSYSFQVFKVEDGNIDPQKDTTLTLLDQSVNRPINLLNLPQTSEDSVKMMAKTRLVITYTQHVEGTANLALSLKTTLGQIYQIKPYGSHNATYQTVEYF